METWVVTIGNVQVLVRATDSTSAGQRAARRLRVTVSPDSIRCRRAAPRDLERWAEADAAVREPGILRVG